MKNETEQEKLPRINWGALFMPAVWGPAHGQWATIIFYPLWIFADTCFVNASRYGGLALVLAVTVFLGTGALTVWFAATVGPLAWARAQRVQRARGQRDTQDAQGQQDLRGAQSQQGQQRVQGPLTLEQHLKRERVWAVVSAALAAAFLAAATWYNLTFVLSA